jgi:hypothetical protein
VVIMLRLDGFYLVLVIVHLIFLSGCCEPYEQPQPARPKQVSGWKDSPFSGVHSVAELILKEEESSENGRIGVKVVSISQPEKCVKTFSEPKTPEAVVRIYRVVDQQVLFEGTVSGGAKSLAGSPLSNPEFGISVLFIDGINTKERWVWFDLRE